VNTTAIAITSRVRDSTVPILCLLSLHILNGSIVRPALVSFHIYSHSNCFPSSLSLSFSLTTLIHLFIASSSRFSWLKTYLLQDFTASLPLLAFDCILAVKNYNIHYNSVNCTPTALILAPNLSLKSFITVSTMSAEEPPAPRRSGRLLTKTARWDDWVSTDRIRKFTEENKELAQSLKREVDNTRKPAPSKVTGNKKKAAGSDLSSTRGSEERQSSAPATGRGQKRGRDTEIEKVGSVESHSSVSSPLSELASGDVSTPSSGPEINPTTSQESRVSSSPTSSDITGSSATEDSAVSGRPPKKRKTPSKPKTPGKRKAPRKRKASSTSSVTTEPEDIATIVDRILAQDPPKEKRVRRFHEPTGEYIDWPLLTIDPKRKSVARPAGPHPQLRKSYRITPREDLGYLNRFVLYRYQNHNHRIMVAGVPPEDPVHHLHSAQPSMERITPAPERDGNLIIDFDYQAINTIELQEETFHARPHIRIPCPDNLKSLLVDDWENVTKNLQLVPLPSKTPVNTILDNYFEEEKGKRRLGSAEADLLEEVVAGVKEYFDKALGRILLYRFEREQFTEIRSMWEGAVGGQWEGKGAGDVYGAEHLARLFGTCTLRRL